VQELPAATQYAENPYTDWDGEKIQACVCDGGFYGPDCSLRFCPKGDDPMTICDTVNNEQVQRVSLQFNNDGTTTGGVDAAVENDDLVLIFTDNHNETWYTPRIENVWHDSTAPNIAIAEANIEKALMSIPNFKIPSVTVNYDAGSSVDTIGGGAALKLDYLITFDSSRTSGNQRLLSAQFPLGCMTKGCQPKYKQLRLMEPANGAHAGVGSITVDSVLTGFDAREDGGTVSSATTEDIEIVIEIERNASSSYHSYATRFFVNGDFLDYIFHGRVPDAIANKGIGFDHAPLGYGMFYNFDSRTPTHAAGGYSIHMSTAKVVVTEHITANSEKEDIECSGRGACDVTSGNCACFEGYYGDHCGQQTILV